MSQGRFAVGFFGREGYCVVDTRTGRKAWLHWTGKRCVFLPDGTPMKPTDDGFTERWSAVLNAHEKWTLKQHFPAQYMREYPRSDQPRQEDDDESA